MKAIKIASLTVLAAAISAQAAADFYITKGADLTVSGHLQTQATVNLSSDVDTTRQVVNVDGGDETFVKFNVNNKVFNADVKVGTLGDNPVKLSGVTVTDGDFKFGQIGELSVKEYAWDLTNTGPHGVDAGIQYNGIDNVAVQLEGKSDAFGVAAQYAADVAKGVAVKAVVQYRETDKTPAVAAVADDPATPANEAVAAIPAKPEDGMTADNTPVYVGAGVTVTAVDNLTLKAAVQYGGAGATKEVSVVDVSASADYKVADVTVSAAVNYGTGDGKVGTTDLEVTDLDAMAKVAYAADGIAVSAAYTFKTLSGEGEVAGTKVSADINNGKDETDNRDVVELDASYTQGAFKYFAGAALKLEEEQVVKIGSAETTTTFAGNTELKAGVVYTSANKATYEAKLVNAKSTADEAKATNVLSLTATYSF